jgi:hypothetical protein
VGRRGPAGGGVSRAATVEADGNALVATAEGPTGSEAPRAAAVKAAVGDRPSLPSGGAPTTSSCGAHPHRQSATVVLAHAALHTRSSPTLELSRAGPTAVAFARVGLHPVGSA